MTNTYRYIQAITDTKVSLYHQNQIQYVIILTQMWALQWVLMQLQEHSPDSWVVLSLQTFLKESDIVYLTEKKTILFMVL